MSKVLIETYRSFDIHFDPSQEEFISISDYFDTQVNKKSFTATKKAIDDYIKANSEFKPVWVESTENTWGHPKKIKLIGIRKDNRFIYEDEKGNKVQLSEYSEKEYFLVNPENEPIFKKINELKAEKDRIDGLIDLERKKLIKVGLDDIKAKYKL